MIRQITLTQLGQVVTTLDSRLRRGIVRGLQASAMRFEGIVVEEIDNAEPYPAVDTGGLRQSVDRTNLPDGSIVAVKAPHAAVIEHGSRPHFPPINPLVEWVKRKGMAKDEEEARRIAHAIARKIAERGTEPRHFMAKAWARLPPILAREIQRALDETARRGA